jgi:hypothetical protein
MGKGVAVAMLLGGSHDDSGALYEFEAGGRREPPCRLAPGDGLGTRGGRYGLK